MSVLPSGFIRVEYLESSGTQYIDTEFYPKYNSRVVADVSGVSGTGFVFGVIDQNSATASEQFCIYRRTNTTMRSDYFGTNKETNLSDVAQRTIIDKNANIVTMYSIVITNTAVTSGACTYPLYLLAANNVGTRSTPMLDAVTLYSCQIYDNGTMVRDYCPAVRVSDGVAGLYDIINDVFYTNAGSGTFTVGKYVVDSDEILPLEYIESTGTQYVDSGFVPNQDTRVVMSAMVTEISGFGSLGGAAFSVVGGGYYYTLFFNTNGTLGSRYGTQAIKNFGLDAPPWSEWISCDKNKNVTTANGYTVSANYETFEMAYSGYLFARNNAGAVDSYNWMRLKSCQIYDNGTIVRDYIPAKIPATDDIGLWDRLSGAFYVDAAGGSFVAGPIVVEDEAEIVKVEYIESSGTQYIDTRFVPNQDTRAVLSAYNLSSSSVWTFGCWTANGSKQFAFCCLNTYSFRYGTDGVQLTTLPVGPVSAELNKNVYTLNGTTGTLSAQTFTCDYSMYLFRINAAGAASSGKFIGRAYSFQIYDNGTIARDYTPAIFRSVVGLYDKENGIFYDNAGTGVFIAGPEIQETAEVPTGVHLTERTENSVSFAWDDMGADAYRVYKNGALLAEVSATNYTDSGLQSGDLNTYSVSSVSGELESSAAQLGYVQTVLPGVSGLITDRTLADVNAVKNTAAAILSGTATAEQITEFSRWMKGAYSDIDLNRVEDAVAFIVQTLNGFEDDLREYLAQQDVQEDPIFFPAWVTQKIELVTFVLWQESDYPVTEDMARYLSNVSTIRAALPGISAPALPGSMAGLGYTSANAIEAVLVAAFSQFQTLSAEQYALVDRAVLSFVGCNEFGCGEV